MRYVKDMTGKTFGNLTVIELTHRTDGKGRAFWKCKCEICKRLIEVRGDNLRRGISTKCSYCTIHGGRNSREII